MNESEAAMADELERTRDDEGEWSEEPVDIEVRPGRTQVVSFRLPLDELQRLTACAKTTGESLSGFIREAIDTRIQRTFVPFIRMSHTMHNVTVYSAPASYGWTEGDYSFEPPMHPSAIDEELEGVG